MEKKLPVGIQDFDKIRTDNFLYVDKTEYIFRLAHNNVPYFLSRPRRFGKSLLISTMKAYWEGRKELFQGLAIDRLEKDDPDAWKPYPVFCFDFNGVNYRKEGALERKLDFLLSGWEDRYGSANRDNTLEERFENLLKTASQKTGRRTVVLIDEYDKPLLDTVDDEELQIHNKEVFRGFFSTLKTCDEYIHFLFITGVSKFHKVSIFSDLNQLKDISLTEEYASLCGITEKELHTYFAADIRTNAEKEGISEADYLQKLRAQYDGYRFYPEADGIYNPFSLLSSFFDGAFGSYWFETGTPSFLVNRVRQDGFDVRKFTSRDIYASDAVLKDYTGDTLDLVPLLYQTGYLTITDYDKRRQRYTLGFPNEEVKYGFLESLMPAYAPKANAGHGLDIFTLDEYVENGRLDDIRNVLTALFASITYTMEEDPFEHYFQSVIYIVFTLLGKYALCETHTYTGRIDCKVETKDYIYLFEFKRDDTAKAALAQIEEKDYSLPFVADSRKLYKIGVSFDSATRKLTGWEVAE